MKKLIIGYITAVSILLSTSYASQANTSAQIVLRLAIMIEAQTQHRNLEGVILSPEHMVTSYGAKNIKKPSYEKTSNNTQSGYPITKKKRYKFLFR
jgi:hypothetical protein